MKTFLKIFFSNYQWARKFIGGRWAYAYVDFPVADHCWMKIPDDAPRDYRAPLWRCQVLYEDWRVNLPES